MAKAPNAVLLVGMGGPETAADVPAYLDGLILRHVLADDLRREFEERFRAIGGSSPHNAQACGQAEALEDLLHARGRFLRVRTGFLYSFPSVFDTIKSLASDGKDRILTIPLYPLPGPRTLSIYGQTLSRTIADVNVERRNPVVSAPARPYHDRPGFIQASASRIQDALGAFASEAAPSSVETVFIAPPQPEPAAAFEETARLTASRAGLASYHTSQPGPPLLGLLEELSKGGPRRVLLSPLGFTVDGLDVLWGLDQEARRRAEGLGLTLVRARTVQNHPSFIATLSSIVEGTQP